MFSRFLAILKWFKVEHGSVILSNGHHEVEIETQCVPEKVFISTKDYGNIPTCAGNTDYWTITYTNHGFILIVQQTSTEREYEWFAI